MAKGAKITRGSKTFATVDRTVGSVEVVVSGNLVVGCTNIVSSVVSHLMPRSQGTLSSVGFFTSIN